MSDPNEPPDELTPAEQALEGHLELLRGAVLAPSQSMDYQILRRARWQRTVRRPLLTIGHFAEAVRDSIRLLFMPPNHR
jgi:hypothetical protein